MASKVIQEFEERGTSSKLVVLLHGYTMKPKHLSAVQNTIREMGTLKEADIFTPRLPASTFSFRNPVTMVCQLLSQIDLYWDKRIDKHKSPYESIIIVGHCLGALLGRKLYIYACGETPGAPFEDDVPAEYKSRRDWAEKVDRIVLLAGMNRGWSISHHMSILKAIVFTAGTVLGSVISHTTKRKPLIFHIRRGAPFLTNLRIQWLAMRNEAPSSGVGSALTVQLLGSVDDMVSPEDNIDLVSGRDFVYLDVPKTGHTNIIDMDDSADGQERIGQFQCALNGTRKDLEDQCALPQDTELTAQHKEVKDVIFIIHGIRDLGYWTHKIARRVKALAKKRHKVFESDTSSYGYFPMLSFIFPWRRRAKVEWLMDQYAEKLAQYPNASFSYIGHSNGTYLLTKALKEYPCCRFKNVVLAGSVVRTDYDWATLLEKGRVMAVLNYVATADWVVAGYPNVLQILNWQDLGGAGYRGFDSDTPNQIRYVRGTHSAALNEDNWDSIATFVIEGKPVLPPQQIKETKQAWWVLLLGHVAPLVLLVSVLILAWICCELFPKNLTLDDWRQMIIFLLYVSGIYLILTRL
jgi:pimeloyl-ACP methyl ester carboxylesterase